MDSSRKGSAFPLHHLELNVSDRKTSLAFYQGLAVALPGTAIEEHASGFSWSFGAYYLWFNEVQPRFAEVPYHRKRVGLDHIALRLSGREEVLALQTYFRQQDIPLLYPADYYGSNYFAVYIEDPDRIKLEFGADVPLGEK